MGDHLNGLEGRDPSNEVYPSAPLAAVAVEVYFSDLLDAHARFGAFQRAHATEFTRLLYPNDRDFDDGFDRPHTAILASPNTERAVAVAPDQLSVVTYVYAGGFGGFTEWALPLLNEGLEVLGVRTLTKVRYRYENVIPLPRPDVELTTILNVTLPRAEECLSARHLHLYWKQMWREGTVDVSLVSCYAEEEKATIELNITGQRAGHFEGKSQLETAVFAARRMARLTFEDLITPEYRNTLRGGKA